MVNRRLSVRETERLVAATLKQTPATKARPANDGGRDTRRLEEELSDLLAASVKIKLGGRGRGKVTIDFGNLDALEGILTKLRGSTVETLQLIMYKFYPALGNYADGYVRSAGMILITLPIIVMYLIFQRYFLEQNNVGGLK